MRRAAYLTAATCLLLLSACETAPEQPTSVEPPHALEPAPAVLYVQPYMLNLRACPGMECTILLTLRRGAEVAEIESQAPWRRVRVSGTEIQGWVGASFVEPSPPAAGTPAPGAGGRAAATSAGESGDPDASDPLADPQAAVGTPDAGHPSQQMPSGVLTMRPGDAQEVDAGPTVEEEFAP